MKRLLSDDQERVEEAMMALDKALDSLGQVDLRTYGGDTELRDAIRQARAGVRSARTACRLATALKWKR